MDSTTAEGLYRTIVRIRFFEEKVQELFGAGELPGFVHLYMGQEACATGVCANLGTDDYITSTHRGHGHCIAKGGRPDRMMAELYGKSTGYNKGRGGSMHIASPEIGILGANGILAAGLPLAVGAALTAKMQKNGKVVAAFLGDAASNQGTFHESLNLAAIQDLPVLFVCENNQFGVGTRITEATRVADVAKRVVAYGIPGEIVDGQDVVAVYEAAGRLIQDARDGKGPALLELKTWRFRAHFEGEPATYRTKEEEKQWLQRDPLVLARERFTADELMTIQQCDEIDRETRDEILAAVEFARTSPDPRVEDALQDVFT